MQKFIVVCHWIISMSRLFVQLRIAAVLGLLPWVAVGSPPAEYAYSIDVAVIDRARILKAAQAALALEPINITTFSAALSEGGPNDFIPTGITGGLTPPKPTTCRTSGATANRTRTISRSTAVA
jgi:hypothetical protein